MMATKRKGKSTKGKPKPAAEKPSTPKAAPSADYRGARVLYPKGIHKGAK